MEWRLTAKGVNHRRKAASCTQGSESKRKRPHLTGIWPHSAFAEEGSRWAARHVLVIGAVVLAGSRQAPPG